MRTKILYFVFVALASAPAVFGQQDDRAAQVLAMSRRAIGDDRLETLKTMSLQATVQRNVNTMQLSTDTEILLEMPDKYVRSDQSSTPGLVTGGMSTGFNGEKPIQPVQGGLAGGAFVIRMGGPAPAESAKLSPEEQERAEKSVVRGAKQELSRLMLGWFAAAHPSVSAQYAFAGEAESPDGRAYVIDVTNADGFSARLFIDQRTNLPLMVTYRGPQRQMMTSGTRAPGGPAAHGGGTVGQRTQTAPVMVDYTLYFDDWQSVDGVRFPHKIRRAAEGSTTEEWTVSKVKINPKIDPKKFAVKG
jgi:hypothetical protein